jgi:uncharacterized protein (DUF486 family)
MIERLGIIWSFLLLFSVFAFSLLMGTLLFFRLRRFHFLAHLLGTLLPFVLFIFFSWLIYIYGFYRAHPDERCGGPLMGALGIIGLGIFGLAVFSPLAQWLLHTNSQRCGARPT